MAMVSAANHVGAKKEPQVDWCDKSPQMSLAAENNGSVSRAAPLRWWAGGHGGERFGVERQPEGSQELMLGDDLDSVQLIDEVVCSLKAEIGVRSIRGRGMCWVRSVSEVITTIDQRHAACMFRCAGALQRCIGLENTSPCLRHSIRAVEGFS